MFEQSLFGLVVEPPRNGTTATNVRLYDSSHPLYLMQFGSVCGETDGPAHYSVDHNVWKQTQGCDGMHPSMSGLAGGRHFSHRTLTLPGRDKGSLSRINLRVEADTPMWMRVSFNSKAVQVDRKYVESTTLSRFVEPTSQYGTADAFSQPTQGSFL